LELIGVPDLQSIVVDNAWNENAEESAQSLASGKTRLIDMTEWFLA
jgi:FMN-dependent NADH-azoreductase